jgi:septal ring factor EnvC (AmiA/AmiB activator)
MSITPSPNLPESAPPPPATYQVASTPRWIYVVLILLFAGIAYLGYSGYNERAKLESDLSKSSDRADQLSARLDQANSRIADLRGQLDVTSSKLGLTEAEVARAHSLAQQIQQSQKVSDAQLGAQIGEVKKDSEAKIGAVSTALDGAKTDIAGTKKDLEDTKGKLLSTVGDLGVQSGLIARNQQEVEELKRIGERNIYDFSLQKAKTPQRIGPVQLKLEKVDTKHYRYTMLVYADDKQIEKKDKTADEPVQFYVRGARAPYEIVVFEVGKDKVSGYLSTPKDVAATAAPPAKPQQ